MTDKTKTPEKMPERIALFEDVVCSGAYDWCDASLFKDLQVAQYVRADVAYPVTKEDARDASDKFEKWLKSSGLNEKYFNDNGILQTIRALLEAASK